MRKALKTVRNMIAATFLIAFVISLWGCEAADQATLDAARGDELLQANKYIFVTEPVDGNLGGLTGADELCQDTADAAGIQGTYIAFLSTSTINAIDRVPSNGGPWYNEDDVIKFETKDDLRQQVNTGNQGFYSTEGILHSGKVYTGTLRVTGHFNNLTEDHCPGDVWSGEDCVSGVLQQIQLSSCDDWTSNDSMTKAGTGDANATQPGEWLQDDSRFCDQLLPIYCLEI